MCFTIPNVIPIYAPWNPPKSQSGKPGPSPWWKKGIFYWCLAFIIVFIHCPNVIFIIPLIWFDSEIVFLFEKLCTIIFHRLSLYSSLLWKFSGLETSNNWEKKKKYEFSTAEFNEVRSPLSCWIHLIKRIICTFYNLHFLYNFSALRWRR